MDKIMYRTLIIDDEHPARQFIKELLEPFSDIFNIIGEATNGNEAIKLINTLNPDLIFLDIQMPGKNGFEVVQSLNRIPIIIFCTAYDDYALEAFETNSIDYLVKPVDPERLQKTVDKLQNFGVVNNQNEIKSLIQNLVSNHTSFSSYPNSIPIRLGDRVVFVKIKEISFFKAKDKYVEIYTLSGKSYLCDLSLNYLELKLPSYFLRVQRSYIINSNRILEIRKYSLGRYILLLNDLPGSKIKTGKNYSKVINNLIKV